MSGDVNVGIPHTVENLACLWRMDCVFVIFSLSLFFLNFLSLFLTIEKYFGWKKSPFSPQRNNKQYVMQGHWNSGTSRIQIILFIKAVIATSRVIRGKKLKTCRWNFWYSKCMRENVKMVSLGIITKTRMKLSREKETVGVQRNIITDS